MDDMVYLRRPVAPPLERLWPGGLGLLVAYGLMMLLGVPDLPAQETTPRVQGTPSPDPCKSPWNEKLTPFQDRLLDQLETAVRTSPSKAPDIVVQAIATTVSNPLNYPGHVIQRAIRALGSRVNQSNIARIVFEAVRARPEAVLLTVQAAIRETRPALHRAIVAAAVAAIGNPYLRVDLVRTMEYFRQTLNVPLQAILGSGIRCVQASQETVEEEALAYKASNLDEAVTLAEAIVGAAIQAGSTVSSFDLAQAVNQVLQNAPGLPSLVGDPSDWYTNITVPPPVTPPPSTPTPTPSPVSP
jgi:hypothetical protein